MAATGKPRYPGPHGSQGLVWDLFFRFGPPRWSRYIRSNWAGQRLVIGVPYLWLLLFFLVPFLIVLKISLAEFSPLGRPPYEPILRWLEDGALQVKLLFTSYIYLFNEPLYVSAWLYSVKVALLSTLFCLVLGYPMAYAIARASPSTRNILLMLIILPFWTSFLLRVYAWIGLLKTDGVINNVLQALGIIQEPLVMMNTNFAVYIGIVYSYLPFMILPLYANLEKHDLTLLEAAQDLGSGPVRSFLRITLPLSFPGIMAGSRAPVRRRIGLMRRGSTSGATSISTTNPAARASRRPSGASTRSPTAMSAIASGTPYVSPSGRSSPRSIATRTKRPGGASTQLDIGEAVAQLKRDRPQLAVAVMPLTVPASAVMAISWAAGLIPASASMESEVGATPITGVGGATSRVTVRTTGATSGPLRGTSAS